MSPPDGILAVILLQVAPPEPPAVEIIGRQLAVAEMRDDHLAVGHWRRAGQVLRLVKLLMAALVRRLAAIFVGHRADRALADLADPNHRPLGLVDLDQHEAAGCRRGW